MNTYKKLSDGTWGAWIDTGYGESKVDSPCRGEVVQIGTKAGGTHERVVASVVKEYASGCSVRLFDREEFTTPRPGGHHGSPVYCVRCGSYCEGDCETDE
jgi:hypothetical protein